MQYCKYLPLVADRKVLGIILRSCPTARLACDICGSGDKIMMRCIRTDGTYTLKPRAMMFTGDFRRGFRERPEQNIVIEWHRFAEN